MKVYQTLTKNMFVKAHTMMTSEKKEIDSKFIHFLKKSYFNMPTIIIEMPIEISKLAHSIVDFKR